MPYLLSIIIPTLNEEKFLPVLLTNLINQKEKDFEVIIVDANSKDKTRTIAKSFRNHFPLHVVTSDKQNIALQRNIGAQKSKGKYFIFLDADSQVYPLFTQRIKKIVQGKKDLLLLPSLVPDKQTVRNKAVFSVVNAVIEASQTMKKPLTTAGCMIVEKNFFKKMKGFDEKAYITEDHDFVIRAKKLGVKARFLRDVKIVFSLRRARKEGELTLLGKYLVTSTYMLMTGKVKENIFPYEMGGHIFSEEL